MEAKTRKPFNPFSWNWAAAFETVREYAETILMLLFIVNGLATFLILFNWVEAGEDWSHIIGSLSFAFSAVALMRITHQGVKHQTTKKKKK